MFQVSYCRGAITLKVTVTTTLNGSSYCLGNGRPSGQAVHNKPYNCVNEKIALAENIVGEKKIDCLN